MLLALGGGAAFVVWRIRRARALVTFDWNTETLRQRAIALYMAKAAVAPTNLQQSIEFDFSIF